MLGRVGLSIAALALLTAACTAGPDVRPAASPTPAGSGPASAVSVSPTAAPTGLPRPDHIVVVVFENKDVDEVLGTGEAPFLDDLARTGVDFTNAHGETHPSQPNYLALFSGGPQGVTDNSCLPSLSAPNLATQLMTAGRSFVGYSEDLPTADFTGCTSGDYAQKHAPWAAFTNLPAGSHQPWTAWPSAYEQLPTVAMVIPNLCHDMHDCDVATGDQWLREHLSSYLEWARLHNSLLLVTFDESGADSTSNHIVTLLDGAGIRPGRVDEPVDHYRLLRTVEAMYGLPALGRAADTAPITTVWTTS